VQYAKSTVKQRTGDQFVLLGSSLGASSSAGGVPYENHNGLWPSVPYSVRNANLVVTEHVYVQELSPLPKG
jgi:hypothetical protein